MSKSYKTSITWKWTVTGKYDTKNLSTGTEYVVELPLKLNGRSRDGWESPLTFDLTPPQGTKPSPITVYPKDIELGSYKNFPFPSFTAQGDGTVLFTATTKQTKNLPSALLVADSNATIKGTDVKIGVAITWTWSLTASIPVKDLSTGTKYQIDVPLKLNGGSHEGWENPLSLQLQLPFAKDNPSPNTVYPNDIKDSYNDFSFPQFIAQKTDTDDTVDVAADTNQSANLPSSLLVADEKVKLKEAK